MTLSLGTVASAANVASGLTSYALSFGATASSSGVLYFVATINKGSANTPTVVGSITGTFSLRGDSPTNDSIWAWSAPFTTSQGSQTITITLTGGDVVGFLTVVAFEIEGAATTSYFDPNLTSAPVESGGPDPASMTTTNANDFLIGAFRMNSVGSPSGLQGAGWTQVAAPAGGNTMVEYQIVSATQTALSVNLSGGAVGDSNGIIADAIIAAAVAAQTFYFNNVF